MFVDLLRAAAPLIVLWAHLGPLTRSLSAGNWLLWTALQGVSKTLHLLQGGGHLGVLLFFLVSGFIISYVADREPRSEFAIKRVARIMPMLFGGVIIAYLSSKLGLLLGLPFSLQFSLTDLARSLFLLDNFRTSPQLLSVTWSLVTEVSFYLLVVLFYDLIVRRPVQATYVLIVTITAMQLVLGPVAGDTVPAVFFIKQALFIMVGRAVYLAWAGRTSLLNAATLSGSALISLAGCYLLTPYSRSLLFSRDSVVYSWMIALAIFGLVLALPLRRTPPVARFFSDISYSTYMVHLSIGTLIIRLTFRTGIGPTFTFLVALGTVLLLSYLTYLTIELPGQRLGRSVISKLRQPLEPCGVSDHAVKAPLTAQREAVIAQDAKS